MKGLFKKIIIGFLFFIMLPVGVVSAKEFNYLGDSNREIYLRGKTIDMNIPHITVDDMQAYCAEYKKDVPHKIPYAKADSRVEYDSKGVLAIIYHGYPKNISHLQEKYNLTDDEALMLTQYSLWNYIEGWDREQATEPYARELIAKGDNEEIDDDSFNLEENKLFFHEKDGFLETDFISSNGKNRKFTVKTDEGTKVYDESGKERYNFVDGERFMVRNVSQQKEDSTITIVGSYDVDDLEVYEPNNEIYQDLIRAGIQSRSLNESYTVSAAMMKERAIVQTADNEFTYLILIMLGCVVYIVLNMDIIKKYR